MLGDALVSGLGSRLLVGMAHDLVNHVLRAVLDLLGHQLEAGLLLRGQPRHAVIEEDDRSIGCNLLLGGNGRTFWDIYDYLPRETRGYVPAFIGASYAYAYHRQHGIELTEAPIPLATDTIRIDRLMHLGQIASTIDIPIETLRQLNPQYKLDIIPATTKPYTLVLPQRNITQYIANEPAIFAKDSAYLKEYINPANIDKKRQERSGTVYVVKKGDTLGAIARRYRVTTAQLMRWNGIKNAHKLRLGQRIRIEGR